MPTIEISASLAERLKAAQGEALDDELENCAREFIDVTEIGMPPDQRVFVHALTGRRVTVRAEWDDA